MQVKSMYIHSDMPVLFQLGDNWTQLIMATGYRNADEITVTFQPIELSCMQVYHEYIYQ